MIGFVASDLQIFVTSERRIFVGRWLVGIPNQLVSCNAVATAANLASKALHHSR